MKEHYFNSGSSFCAVISGKKTDLPPEKLTKYNFIAVDNVISDGFEQYTAIFLTGDEYCTVNIFQGKKYLSLVSFGKSKEFVIEACKKIYDDFGITDLDDEIDNARFNISKFWLTIPRDTHV